MSVPVEATFHHKQATIDPMLFASVIDWWVNLNVGANVNGADWEIADNLTGSCIPHQ